MTPTVDERLASVVRSLTEVILPHLPPEASLAQEQVQLAIGHLQILRGQLDQIGDYEREELDDARELAVALGQIRGSGEIATAQAALAAAADKADGTDVRGQRKAIHEAIEGLIASASDSGDEKAHQAVAAVVIEHEDARAQKDRRWFAPFGFDTL